MLFEEQNDGLCFTESHKIFLNPIALENPCGEYLRRHPLMIKLKELRNQLLVADEDLGIWAKKNNDIPSWDNIISLCEEIFTTQSKDLQVCAYYAEAKLNVEGFSGLAFSLSLMLNLCKEYWDNIYPPIEDGNFELRLSSFHWLQINLPGLISSIPLIKNKIICSDNKVASWFWYEKESKIGANESAQAKIFLLNAIANEEDKFIFELYFNFSSILMSLKLMEEEYVSEISQLDDRGVSLEEVISQCKKILSFIQPIYVKRNEMLSANSESSDEEEKNLRSGNEIQRENRESSKHLYLDGNVSSNEEAYQLINKANSYLLKNDPHSPSPYLIRRALEWRKKSLYGVLIELFTTTSKPQEIFTLLGLSRADMGDEEYKK